MRTLIIGSTAAKHNGIDLGREPKDLDRFTADYSEPEDFWHPSFEGWIEGFGFATPDELYTIKVSHLPWELKNGSWAKHVSDAIILKKAGCKVIQPLHDLLYKVWEEKHGKKLMNLNQNAADFFSDAVTRIYEHDSIHDSVAYGDRPMYESVLNDNAEVGIDMRKVKAMSFEDRVMLYREEIYATALERWIIPNNYKFSPGLAYLRALKKTITSLTKGWSAQFLIENLDVFSEADSDYVARHKSKSHLLIPLS